MSWRREGWRGLRRLPGKGTGVLEGRAQVMCCMGAAGVCAACGVVEQGEGCQVRGSRQCTVVVVMLVMLDPWKTGSCGLAVRPAREGKHVGAWVTKHIVSCAVGLLRAGGAWGCSADQQVPSDRPRA